ncbi:hypothetical protein [Pseudorhodoferax sp. Leaf265]|nr:hypothetical protein [Pseudorhodoferax sp. Leaf265]
MTAADQDELALCAHWSQSDYGLRWPLRNSFPSFTPVKFGAAM